MFIFLDHSMGFGWISILTCVFIGSGFLVGVRRWRFTKDILPIEAGKTLLDRIRRFLFLLVVIGGVAMFWRGWWCLGDKIAVNLNYDDKYKDAWWSFFVGTTGMAVIYLTPLSSMLLNDAVGVAGG